MQDSHFTIAHHNPEQLTTTTFVSLADNNKHVTLAFTKHFFLFTASFEADLMEVAPLWIMLRYRFSSFDSQIVTQTLLFSLSLSSLLLFLSTPTSFPWPLTLFVQ